MKHLFTGNKNLQVKKDLSRTAKVASGITIIFVVLEKYSDILLNSLAGTGKCFFAKINAFKKFQGVY